MEIIAKTFAGLEEVLKKEIEVLGGKNVQTLQRSVSFEGDKKLLYQANYCLRTALKILIPIKNFEFENVDEFYENIYGIEWENYFSVDKSIEIDDVVNSQLFKNTHFAALKTKDAIVDRFRDKFNRRPNVDKKNSQIKINLYIKQNYCNISIDTSGEPLFKRGYRIKQVAAPINEVLAAAIIQMSEWNTNVEFLDFMCGSGTFPIEAVMYGLNIPPQYNRKDFAFKNCKDFDANLWKDVVNEANDKQSFNKITVSASDISQMAVDIATENIANAKLSLYIDLKRSSFDKLSSTKPKHIVFNPPYWKRISGEGQSVEEFYKTIGDSLKNNFKESNAWMFTGNLDAIKHIGLHASKKVILYNGAIESRLVKYELY